MDNLLATFSSLPDADKSVMFERLVQMQVQISSDEKEKAVEVAKAEAEVAKAEAEVAKLKIDPNVAKILAGIEKTKLKEAKVQADIAQNNAAILAMKSDQMKLLATYKQEAEKQLKLSAFGRVLFAIFFLAGVMLAYYAVRAVYAAPEGFETATVQLYAAFVLALGATFVAISKLAESEADAATRWSLLDDNVSILTSQDFNKSHGTHKSWVLDVFAVIENHGTHFLFLLTVGVYVIRDGFAKFADWCRIHKIWEWCVTKLSSLSFIQNAREQAVGVFPSQKENASQDTSASSTVTDRPILPKPWYRLDNGLVDWDSGIANQGTSTGSTRQGQYTTVTVPDQLHHRGNNAQRPGSQMP